MEDTTQYVQNMENLANQSFMFNNPIAGFLGNNEKYDTMQNINAMQYQSAVNSNEAEKLRNWQEYMSNTEIQRRVKDLEAVGFSPMALFGNVSGASTPSGASGSAGTGSNPVRHPATSMFMDMMKTVGLLVLGGAKLGAANSLAGQKLALSNMLAEDKIDALSNIALHKDQTHLDYARIMKGIRK